MQRVGFERLAGGRLGDAIEDASAQEVDHDRRDDDAKCCKRYGHRVAPGRGQPVRRFPRHC